MNNQEQKQPYLEASSNADVRIEGDVSGNVVIGHGNWITNNVIISFEGISATIEMSNMALSAFAECIIFALAILSLYVAQKLAPLNFSMSQLLLAALTINCFFLFIAATLFYLFGTRLSKEWYLFGGILLGALPLLTYYLIFTIR
jgi:membrane-associated HD superfamily phosphohydrolase